MPCAGLPLLNDSQHEDKAQAASEGAELSQAEGVEMNSRETSFTAEHAQNSTTSSKTNEERNL